MEKITTEIVVMRLEATGIRASPETIAAYLLGVENTMKMWLEDKTQSVKRLGDFMINPGASSHTVKKP